MTEGAREQGNEVEGMRPRTSTWIAWSLGILWVVLLAPTLLLFTLNLFNPEVEVYGIWVQGLLVV